MYFGQRNMLMKGKYSKAEVSWILYDVANSGFIMALTSVLPIYFSTLAGHDGLDAATATGYWGLCTSISIIITAVLSPILGAIADYEGKKKRLFLGFLIFGILFTVSMAFVNHWFSFWLIIILSRICYTACNVFYDAMLTDVTTEDKVDMISSHGYAWGYIGSCIPFITGIWLITALPFGLNTVTAIRIYIFITAAWWLFMTVPLLVNVKHVYYRKHEPHYIRKAVTGLTHTLGKIYRNKKLFFFILAYFFYIDGVNTIISMATSYGTSLNISATGMIIALLVTQIVAFPASIISGLVAKKMGNSFFIKLAIIAYSLICVYAFFLSTVTDFFVLAVCVGLFQGGIQALSRSHFSKLVPKENASEYFGFFSIFGKFAEILGPLLISLSVFLIGDAKYGILALITLFALGFIFYVKSQSITQDA